MNEVIIEGICLLFKWHNIFFVILGSALGIIVGAAPGLNSGIAVGILLPLSFVMAPETALIFMVSVYVGVMEGGAFSAILLNIPGTGAATATAVDGYPMALKGNGQDAIVAAIIASLIGTFIGSICLLFFAPILAKLSLQFGPSEYVSLGIFGITFMGAFSADNLIKGLFSGLIGMLLGTIGMFFGVTRFSAGSLYLFEGLNLIWVVIGLFVIPQVLSLVVTNRKTELIQLETYSRIKSVIYVVKEIKKMGFSPLYYALIGVITGMVPGAGATLAGWLSYAEAKSKFSSKKYKKVLFGQGRIEGVIAVEIANNASIGGSLVPTLTLGVPGSGTTAILLGALVIAGLKPGYGLFARSGPEVYAIMLSTFLAAIAFTLISLVFLPIITKISIISEKILAPVIIVLAALGSFSAANNYFGIYVSFVIGVLIYFLSSREFHPPTILLGFILSPIVESNLYRFSIVTAEIDTIRFLLGRPITVFLLIASVLVVARQIIIYIRKKEKNKVSQ